MAETVGDISDKIETMPLRIAEDAVYRLDHHLDEVDVLPLVESADVVGFGDAALMEYEVYRAGMVLDIEPVTHVLTLSIDRKRLAVTDIIDKQWDKLLRELVWAVVVRAVGHDGRHAVSVVICTDEMV